uniref:Ribosomal protein S8 n=1 Tax=Sargassum polycystum TaxID=127578 RepID=A0A1S5QNM0_9PHAE|nr:ribosomal protein S8 [Sargassum polycystum]YP_010418155.1 ribosomal protein S8 [Sargassum plagiophyllum]AMO66445.1 ribosomal protein S8 [Sargassum polycystum]USF18208.1 ribosomal protein S8 [Sargassum polycystum]USF18373.1 ribosomal protein S8 [Sargassum plagiophyllum]
MLSRIFNKLRNSLVVYHFSTSFKEVGFCVKILDLLWKENLIRGYTRKNGLITVLLRYYDGSPICCRLTILSRPRDRLYLSSLDLCRLSQDFGVLIVSTPKGIMTAENAIRKGDGGEILGYAL